MRHGPQQTGRLIAVDMRTHARQVMAIERREREKAEALEAVEQEELLRAAANKKKADDETREKATKVLLHPAPTWTIGRCMLHKKHMGMLHEGDMHEQAGVAPLRSCQISHWPERLHRSSGVYKLHW